MKRTPILGLLSIVALGGVFACSSTDTTVNVNGDGGKTDSGGVKTDGGPVDTDGGPVDTDGSTGTDGGTDGASGSTKGGVVFLTQTKPTATTYSTFVGASFFAATASGGGTSACTSSTIGGCTVSECDLTPQDAGTAVDAGTPAAPPTAGDITISGGKIPTATPIVLSPGADKTYTGKQGTSQIYAGGDMVAVKASGGDVPAFDSTIAAPGDLSGFAPALSFTAPIVVDRTMDFTLNWTGGTAGKTTVSLSTAETGKKSVSIICSVDSTANKAVISKDALAKLIPTTATITGILSASPSATSPVKAGDYSVVISASAAGGTGFFKTL